MIAELPTAGPPIRPPTNSPVTCTTHPQSVAHYRCDGCRRFLCTECFEQGHRLVFCRHCRERGIPLDPAVPDERARAAKTARSERSTEYTAFDALRYPFRGSGSLMFWAFLAGLVGLSVVGILPFLGVVAAVLSLFWAIFVLWIIPGTLFSIVRHTESGFDELPDWPDFFEFGSRFREALGFGAGMIVALTPGMLVAQAVGCRAAEWVTGTAGLLCWLIFGVHVTLAVLFWIPAFGAFALFDDLGLVFRLDLHLRAVRAMGVDFWQAGGILAGILAGGQALAFVLLATLPLFGSILSAFVGLYTWFTSSHLIGVLLREHHDAIDGIYWPTG